MTFFDAHTDLLSDVTNRRLRGERNVLRRCHLPRLRAGGMEGGIFSVWIDPPFTAAPAARTQQILSCARAELSECREVRLVRSCAEAELPQKDSQIYAFLGAEGLAALGRDYGQIKEYYDAGFRCAGLTWNESNELASGAMSGCGGGLTAAGTQAVRRIQELGMLLDVSHLNDAGFWDVVRLARRPIAATHSNCRALCGAPRNLTDDQLRAVRDTGGIVGLNSYHNFVDADPARQTVERLAEHAAHMIDVCGIDCVGCGFDFCEFLPSDADEPRTEGLADASQVPGLFACLRRMGLRDAELEKLARGNFLRVLRAAVG